MDENGVIRELGRFPDRIIQPGERQSGRLPGLWKYSNCGTLGNDTPSTVSEVSPCKSCGSIFFEAVLEA